MESMLAGLQAWWNCQMMMLTGQMCDMCRPMMR